MFSKKIYYIQQSLILYFPGNVIWFSSIIKLHLSIIKSILGYNMENSAIKIQEELSFASQRQNRKKKKPVKIQIFE